MDIKRGNSTSDKQTVGSIMIVGGGIAGIQATKLYIVEKSSSIRGVMAQLDKTFPTNDCSMCIISPKLVEAGRHLNIEILTMAEIIDLSGQQGNFEVSILQRPRYIDMDKCIACGICSEKCPKKIDDTYNQNLVKRKAIYIQYPQAVPLKYVIDANECIYFKKGRCRACEKFCHADAINFDDKFKKHSINVGSIILSTGFTPFNPKDYDTYNYTSRPNIITSLEFERIFFASGPYQGLFIRLSDGNPP